MIGVAIIHDGHQFWITTIDDVRKINVGRVDHPEKNAQVQDKMGQEESWLRTRHDFNYLCACTLRERVIYDAIRKSH